MLNWIMQLQLLLTALSALLPFAPEQHRGRIAEVLDVAASALAAGGSIAANLDDLAAKLAAVRSEVEAMAATGHKVNAAEDTWGNLQTVSWDKRRNVIEGGTDPRNPVGKAAVLEQAPRR